MITRRRLVAAGAIGSICAPFVSRPGFATEQVSYLFPAPSTLPAFASFQLAKAKGYFASEGLDVVFKVGKGGVDVATQVGVGNVDFGGGIGDTPILVRPNGVLVKGVALLGGRPLHQLIVRRDAAISSFKDLKGKTIGVVAYQDTSYYNLLAVLKSANLSKDDATVLATGPAGVVQLLAEGKLQAVIGAPEWGVMVENLGTPVTIFQIDSAIPAMAQAILASDEAIKTKQDKIRRFVRASLKGVQDIINDPSSAASAYLAAVNQPADRLTAVTKMLEFYATKVYPVPAGQQLGRFDRARVAKVTEFYAQNNLIRSASAPNDVFSNEFV